MASETVNVVEILREAGYSAEEIAKAIQSGEIKVDGCKKSKFDMKNDKAAEEAAERMKHTDEDEFDEGYDKGEQAEKDKEKKKKKEDKKEDDKEIEKAIHSEVERQVEAYKQTLEKSFSDKLESVEKSMETVLKYIGSQTPAFKSGSITNAAIVEKSMGGDNSDNKPFNGKTPLNVGTQREVIKGLMAEIIASEQTEYVQKSLENDAMNFMCSSDCDQIGVGMARKLEEKGYVLTK